MHTKEMLRQILKLRILGRYETILTYFNKSVLFTPDVLLYLYGMKILSGQYCKAFLKRLDIRGKIK